MWKTTLKPVLLTLVVVAGVSIAVLSIGRTSVAQPRADRIQSDTHLEGRWEVVELTRGDLANKILPEEDMTGFVAFEGDRFRFTIESIGYVDRRSTATFTLDPSQTPNAIDLTFVTGPDAGKTAKGLYEFAGEELRICIPSMDPFDDRPKDFTVAEGSTRMLFVMKRAE
jgi:uncharacterized protein (TIGR03067 family)